MTSLDDLLRHEDEAGERAPRPARRAVLWLFQTGLLAALCAGGLVLVLRVIGYELSYPLAAAGFFALLVLRRIVVGLGVTRLGRLAELPSRDREPPEPDQLAVAIQRWRTRLSWGRAGIRPFTRTSPLIAELVDERLRLRHGLTRASDPERARTLVGEKLWSYLADPDARTPSSRELAALLTEVEKL